MRLNSAKYLSETESEKKRVLQPKKFASMRKEGGIEIKAEITPENRVLFGCSFNINNSGEGIMGAENDNANVDPIEAIADKAYEICNKMLLFEALFLREDEIRLFLEAHNISDTEMQNRYLHLVDKYNTITGCYMY